MPEGVTEDRAGHTEVLDSLKRLFTKKRLHHSEDLSLRRLSRRLGLPDRKVSEAVNRVREVNLSHYVNEYRIRDACTLLRDSDQSILQVALAAGFASKSNFNRHFQRVTGQAPSAWRAAAQKPTARLKGPRS